MKIKESSILECDNKLASHESEYSVADLKACLLRNESLTEYLGILNAYSKAHPEETELATYLAWLTQATKDTKEMLEQQLKLKTLH